MGKFTKAIRTAAVKAEDLANKVENTDFQAKKDELSLKARGAGINALGKAVEASAKAKTTKSPVTLTPEAKGKVNNWRNAVADRLSTDS